MKTFLQYVNEKIATDVVVTPFYNKRKQNKNVIDVIWIQKDKMNDIASYLKKYDIDAKREGDALRVKMPSKYEKKKNDFLLIEDNVLILYDDSYEVLDKDFIKDKGYLHRLSIEYKDKFKYF